jgi:hypothetical protein
MAAPWQGAFPPPRDIGSVPSGGARGLFGLGFPSLGFSRMRLARRWRRFVVIRLNQADADPVDQLTHFAFARAVALHQKTHDGVFENFIQRRFGVPLIPVTTHDQDLALQPFDPCSPRFNLRRRFEYPDPATEAPDALKFAAAPDPLIFENNIQDLQESQVNYYVVSVAYREDRRVRLEFLKVIGQYAL